MHNFIDTHKAQVKAALSGWDRLRYRVFPFSTQSSAGSWIAAFFAEFQRSQRD